MAADDASSSDDHQVMDVTVVTVSYNTLELTALLLWSLYRVLEWPVTEVMVVDNGSTDGSRELLAEAAGAGLCTLIAKDTNNGHGPGLNEAISMLRQRPRLPRRIWILDSDCVIARGDVLTAVFASPTTATAAIVGESHWDRWQNTDKFGLYSLLVDATQTLDLLAVPFADGGDPSITFLDAAQASGLRFADFPFTAQHFVVHRGRGSLAAVVRGDEREHPMYEWAVEHHEPHFGGVDGAQERYEALTRQFHVEVGSLTAGRLVGALRLAT